MKTNRQLPDNYINRILSKIRELSQKLEDCFQSVSNGKALVASAITDKGIETASDATFETMANNIQLIETGGTEIYLGYNIANGDRWSGITMPFTGKFRAFLCLQDGYQKCYLNGTQLSITAYGGQRNGWGFSATAEHNALEGDSVQFYSADSGSYGWAVVCYK